MTSDGKKHSGFDYLKKRKSGQEKLSTLEIQTILIAGILRYLGDMATIDFTLGLAKALYTDSTISLEGNTLEAVSLLFYLEHQIQFDNKRLTEKIIKDRVQHILKKLNSPS